MKSGRKYVVNDEQHEVAGQFLTDRYLVGDRSEKSPFIFKSRLLLDALLISFPLLLNMLRRAGHCSLSSFFDSIRENWTMSSSQDRMVEQFQFGDLMHVPSIFSRGMSHQEIPSLNRHDIHVMIILSMASFSVGKSVVSLVVQRMKR